MLYSFNGSRPAPLPFRIKLPNGFTRTDPSTFTEDEITDAGFTGPFTELSYNPKTEVLDWDGSEYFVRPHNTQELEEQWNKIRVQRNQLLKDSDYTQVSDYNFDITNIAEWQTYRQELRDITIQPNPFEITWPTMPYDPPEEVLISDNGSGIADFSVVVSDGIGHINK